MELAVPLELKEKGNKLFGANRLDEAASTYSKCLSILNANAAAAA